MVNILLLGVITLLLIDIVIDLISARMNHRALSINTLSLPKLPKAGLVVTRKAMIASASKRPALYISNAKNKGDI